MPAIGATAAFGLAVAAAAVAAAHPADGAAFRADLTSAADRLRASRPTAVNLAWALERLLWLVPFPPLPGGGGGAAAAPPPPTPPAAVAATLTASWESRRVV